MVALFHGQSEYEADGQHGREYLLPIDKVDERAGKQRHPCQPRGVACASFTLEAHANKHRQSVGYGVGHNRNNGVAFVLCVDALATLLDGYPELELRNGDQVVFQVQGRIDHQV